ncbi:MAG: DHHA1 domain-containing protein [Acidobacteria bacterium]|nr:DHHA1 domain-containing protein [Acidobacteriota bacterium]
MDTTERLYYQDSHLTKFDARVLSVSDAGVEGRVAVRLDRTAFYPTGGGQPTDTGALDEARVFECVDEEERGVLHLVEAAHAPEVGALVRGEVDWTRRRDHIQQHTGQHILSQAFVELHGAETRGFRMMSEASEIDLELASPGDAAIEEAVNRANEIVWDDRPVRVHHVTAEEAARMPLRKDSEREGALRIVEIEGFDMSPCGGTHAHRTGEVGLVAVRSWERARGLTRITFVAGARALADYRRANRTARAVAALFSAGRDEGPEAVARLLEENKLLLRRARALGETAARAEARELLEEAMQVSGAGTPGGGARLVAQVLEARDAEGLKRLASALVEHAGTVALLGSREGADARLVFARATDAPGDMNALMREACQMLEGRGGGRPDMAQGGGRRSDLLVEAIEQAASKLSDEP